MAAVEGEVVDIGELAFTRAMPNGTVYSWRNAPAVGDTVLYAQYNGQRIGDDPLKNIESPFRIIRDEDVLAYYEGKE